jgi:hypothetical protein
MSSLAAILRMLVSASARVRLSASLLQVCAPLYSQPRPFSPTFDTEYQPTAFALNFNPDGMPAAITEMYASRSREMGHVRRTVGASETSRNLGHS